MTKFKVGDVVIGNILANDYGITVEGWKGEVVDTDPHSINNIFVKDLATKDKYWVDSNCFDLVKTKEDNRTKPEPKTVSVSEDFIKQAYQMADPDLRKVMEEEFKDLFKKEDEPFNFGDEYTLGTSSWNDPLMIGKGLAPKGLELRCLVVKNGYDLEVRKEGEHKVLIFREKK